MHYKRALCREIICHVSFGLSVMYRSTWMHAKVLHYTWMHAKVLHHSALPHITHNGVLALSVYRIKCKV